MDFQGWMLKLLGKSLVRNREYLYRIAEQSDKIIVWLVGFSIGGIALTIGKESELDVVINNLSHYVLVFGSLTVIFGVLYRIFLYLAQHFEIQMLLAFEGYIEGYSNPPDVQYGRELRDEHTYDEIVDFLKEDFDMEIDRVDVSLLDDDLLAQLRKSVEDYYYSLNNWTNKQLDKEIEEVKEVLQAFLGYSDKQLEQVFNPQEPKIKLASVFWFCNYSAGILFLLSCLSFTVGMATILISYLNTGSYCLGE